MLQLLVIYNYLLIKKMTDKNYFIRKETICTNSEHKIEKSCLDFLLPLAIFVLASFDKERQTFRRNLPL